MSWCDCPYCQCPTRTDHHSPHVELHTGTIVAICPSCLTECP